jgi:hypothetical protein
MIHLMVYERERGPSVKKINLCDIYSFNFQIYTGHIESGNHRYYPTSMV